MAIILTMALGGLITVTILLLGLRKDLTPVPLAVNWVKLEEWDGPRTTEDRMEDDDGEVNSQWHPLIENDGSGSDSEGSGPVSGKRESMRPGYGHCCFTSKEVVTPLPTKLYM